MPHSARQECKMHLKALERRANRLTTRLIEVNQQRTLDGLPAVDKNHPIYRERSSLLWAIRYIRSWTGVWDPVTVHLALPQVKPPPLTEGDAVPVKQRNQDALSKVTRQWNREVVRVWEAIKSPFEKADAHNQRMELQANEKKWGKFLLRGGNQ